MTTRRVELQGVPGLATMVLEHAILPVRPGLEAEFESPNLYLLLVEWASTEAHTEGFRGSEDYAQWRALLHHFYDPFPVVEHFLQVL